ncbi:hypothetical protein AX777_21330 [Sphingobium yanoikuyae]|jgi:hypothetical protein|uniref:Uncharacterized protein n=1 Tax=Sphingobium yanoikuyae TaxID=13690 RepID=A0A177JLS6_SPHYA|nr:hypothetical protein [Sphingobium yanoikuyae]OAH41857.1 hypothetical protein AX777_21330 [Sphingobium yanoikuyae]
MFGLMSVKKHKAVVAEFRRQIGVQTDNKRRMAESMDGEARHLRRQLDKMQDRVAAQEAELAHWRANGQLRDPKTGRLIPRAKTADPAAA